MACKYCKRYENTLRKQDTMEDWSNAYHRYQTHLDKYGCKQISELDELKNDFIKE